MTAKRSRKLEHAAMRRRWHKDGTYERLGGYLPACGICGKPEENGQRLDIDHAHGPKQLKPRGLLCRGCNKQMPNWQSWKLRAAADYLDRAEKEAFGDAITTRCGDGLKGEENGFQH